MRTRALLLCAALGCAPKPAEVRPEPQPAQPAPAAAAAVERVDEKVNACAADSDCPEGTACVEQACKFDQPVDTPSPCNLRSIYFGFDESLLTPEARSAIEADWQCLRQTKFRRIRLLGYADERGTTEYHLALGERRADAVKKYLAGLGAEMRRLKSISYGKERPRDLGHDESAWARNRRVDLSVELEQR